MSQSTKSSSKSDAAKSLAEVVRETAEKPTQITSKLEKLNRMEQTMDKIKTENRQLRAALTAKEGEIQSLNHGSRIRVLNVPLTNDEEKNNGAVADKLYNLVLLPLLNGALESGAIDTIPSRDQLIEKAHILPGKQGEHKPIIARFYNHELRSVCFQHKKEYATRISASAKERAGSYCFPFYEDLTKANFMMMRTIGSLKDVQSCWLVNGQIRFKLVDSTLVKRVSSIYDTVENIILKAK